jgi:hypothetical protein
MYQKRVGTLRFDQQDQKQAKGDVLSEVRVNSHGTEHPFIARITMIKLMVMSQSGAS